MVSHGPDHLTASSLGACIAQAAATGNFQQILVGISVMSISVVPVNRLLWRRLYVLADRRFSP